MHRHELLEVLQARPFQPFRIYVSDGATYMIRHPDLVLVTPTAAFVGVSEGDHPGPATERVRIVGLDHITRLEEVEAPSGSGSESS